MSDPSKTRLFDAPSKPKGTTGKPLPPGGKRGDYADALKPCPDYLSKLPKPLKPPGK